MDLTLSDADEQFRAQLRAWFSANASGDEPVGDEDGHFEWRRRWQRKLHEGGWSGIDWPTDYGGRGATLTQSAIFFEELGHAGAPLPGNIIGLMLSGPTIMTWGTRDQKDRYLPPILAADEIWCQGFSEPDAGSDLASLKTRAVRDGNEWVVTGQKVWTSFAQYSDWCILLARTDPDAPKHEGITYFLMDMEQPGIELVPLKQMTGESEFNEMFLDGVRFSDDRVLGGVGNGWKVAMTTLMNERAGLGFFLQVRLRQLVDRLLLEAEQRGRLKDDAVAERLGDLHCRTEALRLLAWKGLTAIERHGQPGPEGSLTKWLWSETNQMLTQSSVDVLGAEALTQGTAWPWSFELLRARGNTIEGGTTEILKNIVAQRVLGLPRSR